MPTYDYKCEECDHVLEAFQKISDEPLKKCPHCNKDTLVRQIGGSCASFQFKGSGFYQTDYKSHQHSSCCPCDKNK